MAREFQTPHTTEVRVPVGQRGSVTMVLSDTGRWTVGVNFGPLPSIFEASSLDEAVVELRRRVTQALDRVPVDSDVELF